MSSRPLPSRPLWIAPFGGPRLHRVKKIEIAAHSAEGGAICFLAALREGAVHLGPHMHPNVVVSAIPMGLSMPGWESNDHSTVAGHLAEGVR